jgi:hypothetical protein
MVLGPCTVSQSDELGIDNSVETVEAPVSWGWMSGGASVWLAFISDGVSWATVDLERFEKNPESSDVP